MEELEVNVSTNTVIAIGASPLWARPARAVEGPEVNIGPGKAGEPPPADVQIRVGPQAEPVRPGEQPFFEPAGSTSAQQANQDPQERQEQTPPAIGTGHRELTTEEELDVREMARRDREVRAHEEAHRAAGGQFVTGGPSYEYERGPDGQQYAVAGEVSIDVSPVANDPQATVNKAMAIRRAALAPADPSGADRRVAARARMMEAEARAELNNPNDAEGQETSATEQGPLPGGSPLEGAENPGATSPNETTPANQRPSSSFAPNTGGANFARVARLEGRVPYPTNSRGSLVNVRS